MTIRRWRKVNFFHKWQKGHCTGALDECLQLDAPQKPGPELEVHLSKRVKRRVPRRGALFDKQRGGRFQKTANRLHELRRVHTVHHAVVE